MKSSALAYAPSRRRAPTAPRPPHPLLATGVPGAGVRLGRAGMSPRELADRILATLLNSHGPIVLCMPGTLSAPYQTSILQTARALVAQHGGPIAVASIPYNNRVRDTITRFVGFGDSSGESVLALVIQGLKAHAPHRPILVVAESQGSWVVAKDLQDPRLAGAVTRVVLFSKPGFQPLPPSVGQAARGAGLLAGRPGVLEIRHTDDIVPSLFTRLGLDVARGYARALREWHRTGEYEYRPHHYDAHGAEAAAYLLRGIVPARPTHRSDEDAPVRRR